MLFTAEHEVFTTLKDLPEMTILAFQNAVGVPNEAKERPSTIKQAKDTFERTCKFISPKEHAFIHASTFEGLTSKVSDLLNDIFSSNFDYLSYALYKVVHRKKILGYIFITNPEKLSTAIKTAIYYSRNNEVVLFDDTEAHALAVKLAKRQKVQLNRLLQAITEEDDDLDFELPADKEDFLATVDEHLRSRLSALPIDTTQVLCSFDVKHLFDRTRGPMIIPELDSFIVYANDKVQADIVQSSLHGLVFMTILRDLMENVQDQNYVRDTLEQMLEHLLINLDEVDR